MRALSDLGQIRVTVKAITLLSFYVGKSWLHLKSTDSNKWDAQTMSAINKLKLRALISGLGTTGLVWGIALYWTLVANGSVTSPWIV